VTKHYRLVVVIADVGQSHRTTAPFSLFAQIH
jgi:hypothetical protein